MRKAVRHRPPDNCHQRFLKIDGQGRQRTDGRPSDDIAEADEKNAQQDPGGRLLLKSGQIRFFRDGVANEGGVPDSGDNP